jgi:hypothetical protein
VHEIQRFTICVTLAVTLAIKPSTQGPSGCAWRDDQFGRGQKHLVGLERPHFGTRFRAQSESWVAPAQFLSVRAMRIWTKQVKKVGITYFSLVFTIFFSL